MKKAHNTCSVFHLDYGDGGTFTSKPCKWLTEAIIQSGRIYPPTSASFDWGGIITPCTTMSILRAMQEASGRIQSSPIAA